MRRSLSCPLISLALLAAVSQHGALLAQSASQAPGTPPPGAAQASSPQAAADIYRVSAFRAAPGQFSALEKLLTATPAPGSDTGDFAVVFRHREGNEWDFMTVEHMGAQATISLTRGPAPQPDSPFSQSVAWHGDTYVAGPPLEEFRRSLNLAGSGAAGGAAGSVYVIGDYMAAAGHRGALRQVLDKIGAETPNRSITLSHIEGAPWNFLTISRYDSWRQFAEDQESTAAAGSKDPSADRGLQLREHLAVHHDTLATIQAVVSPAAR